MNTQLTNVGDFSTSTVKWNTETKSLTYGLSPFSYQVWTDYWPIYPTPTYVTTYPDKFKQAFAVAEMLMEKKLINELSVKEFTALVKEIAATL